MKTKIECNKGALDFLLFSYFKITFEDANDTSKLIEVSIKKAHADATMQGAYNSLFEKENKEAKDDSNEAQEDCQEIIADAINNLSMIHNQNEYDNWHSEICEKLVNSYAENLKDNEEVFFSYGNAQKWLNMTMKYLYLMCGIFAENTPFMKKIGNKVMELSEYLHIPVDSYIIEAVWDESATLPLRPSGRKREGYKYASEKVEPWSKWNKKQYDAFRESLDFVGRWPLEWENEAWIKVAKQRRGK